MDQWKYYSVSFTESEKPEKELKMVFEPDDDVDTYGYRWYNYNW